MAALLAVLAVMSLMLSMALPAWRHAAQREREAELIFRGEQYARAIMLYQRQIPGAYPPDIETLVEGRFLRRVYRDPMIADGEFRLIPQSELAELSGPGGAGTASDDASEDVESVPLRRRRERTPGGVDGNIAGVVSRSEEPSIALYNGQSKYSDWVFTSQGPAGGVEGGESRPPQPGLPDPFGGPSNMGAGVGMGGLGQRRGGR